MSKKRTSPESDTGEKTNCDADVFQEEDHVKRIKLTSLSDVPLEDLPLDILERIFIGAIVLEVEEMHLAKSVWQKKADLAISRLGTVCPLWNSIVTTDFFQNEVSMILKSTAEKTFRLEILHQSAPHGDVLEVIAFKDELFMLVNIEDGKDHVINVYDRNNMARVKDVIALPGIDPQGLAACSVSNCFYVLNSVQYDPVIVYRITKEEEHQFTMTPFLSSWWKASDIDVAANGNIILWKKHSSEQSVKICLYDANGSLQHTLKLTSDFYQMDRIIPKSNGNLVLVTTKNAESWLTEIKMCGAIVRQYQSSLNAVDCVCQADVHGRIMIAEELHEMELLDSEFNPLIMAVPSEDLQEFCLYAKPHYDVERNELLTIQLDNDCEEPVCSIFRFTEE